MSEPEKSAFRKKFDELYERLRDPKHRKTQINVWYIVAALIGFIAAAGLLPGKQAIHDDTL